MELQVAKGNDELSQRYLIIQGYLLEDWVIFTTLIRAYEVDIIVYFDDQSVKWSI